MPQDLDYDELAFWLAGEQYIFHFDNDEPPTTPTKKKSNGCFCVKCGDMYPYAEPNQLDGTFKCWGCRH